MNGATSLMIAHISPSGKAVVAAVVRRRRMVVRNTVIPAVTIPSDGRNQQSKVHCSYMTGWLEIVVPSAAVAAS